jgi:hypothetical protein
MSKESTLGIIGKETEEYVRLAVDEAKLKLTRALSNSLGQILAFLLVFCVLTLVLNLLSLALLQWLNDVLGSPWGTLLVAGVFLLVLIILWANRKRLFRDMFVKLFIDVLYDTDDE